MLNLQTERVGWTPWPRFGPGVLRRALLLLTLLLFFAAPAQAQSVQVGEKTVMRLPTQAAQAAQKRIDEKLQAGADPKEIQARKADGGYGVYWGSTLIVRVDRTLAEENKSTPEGLAGVWARRLREAVGPGLIAVEPKSAVLPIGGTTRITVRGAAQGPIAVSGGDGVVAATVEGEIISLSAVAVGRTSLVLTRGKGKLTVPVWVKDYAGYPPSEVSLKVTGEPAPGQLVAEAALTAVAGKTRVNPGARLQLPSHPSTPPSIPAGQKLRYELPIEILGGDDYFPVRTVVPVQIESVELGIEEPNILVVSNRPERVEDDGVLMEYTFSGSEPTRLMYSHLNETLADRQLWVNLYNESDEPVEVWIGSTFAGPNRNEVHTGHMAAVRFLQQVGSKAGYIVTLPPRSQYVVADHLMRRRDLLSGFANFQILGTGRLRVEVHSALTPARNSTVGVVRLGGPFNPFKIHPHGVFAQPFFEEWVDMTPESEATKVAIGKSPWLIDFETGLPNTGNFGVLYQTHFVFTNPSSLPLEFELVFRPESGPGAGTFLVGDEILEAPFVRRGIETFLKRVRVEPGDEKTVSVLTLPEASSNYPAYIEARPAR